MSRHLFFRVANFLAYFLPAFPPAIGDGSMCLHDGLSRLLPLVAPYFGRTQGLALLVIDKGEEEDFANKKT